MARSHFNVHHILWNVLIFAESNHIGTDSAHSGEECYIPRAITLIKEIVIGHTIVFIISSLQISTRYFMEFPKDYVYNVALILEDDAWQATAE